MPIWKRTARVDSATNPERPAPLSMETAEARLRRDPHDHEALEALGAWHLARHEPAKALEYLHRVTREDSRHPGVWRLKAQAFEALGDTANAARCLARESDSAA